MVSTDAMRGSVRRNEFEQGGGPLGLHPIIRRRSRVAAFLISCPRKVFDCVLIRHRLSLVGGTFFKRCTSSDPRGRTRPVTQAVSNGRRFFFDSFTLASICEGLAALVFEAGGHHIRSTVARRKSSRMSMQRRVMAGRRRIAAPVFFPLGLEHGRFDYVGTK